MTECAGRATGALGKTGATKVKKIPITATGTFTLAIAGGNGGKIDLKVTPKFPKGTTRYTFDATEPTLGTAEDIRKLWLGSAHADLTSEPFAHWNNDSPAFVPQSCAKCHSGLGYRDFLGVLANPYATPPENAPSMKYFMAASWESSRRRRARPHSR